MTTVLMVAASAPSLAAAEASRPCAERGNPFPTFCAIPPVPTGVRGPAAFKAQVVQTRLAGRDLTSETQPARFTLEGTAAFAADAAARAAPPPPITTPGPRDTAAFVKAARNRVQAPGPPR